MKQYPLYCRVQPHKATRIVTLKSLRLEAGLSQHELGQQLAAAVPSRNSKPDYYQPRISAYENGRNTMPLPVAVALVKILNKALKKAGSRKVASVENMVPEKKKPR